MGTQAKKGMKMKKLINMIGLSAALLMAAGSALAQPHMMGGGGMRPGMPGGGMMLQTGLSFLFQKQDPNILAGMLLRA
jgi:hypothetical protein